MKWPAANYACDRPDALRSVGARSARPQLPDHAVGNHSDAFEFTNPRSSPYKQIRGNLGAVNRVPRPLSFPSDPDHLAHVAVTPVVVSSLVADDEHGMGGLTWVQKIGSGAKIPFAVVQSA